MPRRTKDEQDVTDTTSPDAAETAAAGGSEADAATTNGNGEEKARRRSQLEDLPVGPMKTRTGAEATVIQGPKGKRVFTAGGDKGAKIAELLRTRQDLARKDIAAMVGCSQSRVAEVARVLGLSTARQPAASTEPTPDNPPVPQPEPEPAQPQPQPEATSVST